MRNLMRDPAHRAIVTRMNAELFETLAATDGLYIPLAPGPWRTERPPASRRRDVGGVPAILLCARQARTGQAMKHLQPVAIALVALSVVSCARGQREPDAHAGHEPAAAARTGNAAAASAAARVSTTPPPGAAPDGMVWIPGGTFWMGCENCGMPDALPVHMVSVSGFWMDRTPVTNGEFERFVAATGYVTVAERPLDPKSYPGVPKDKLVPGSAVFTPTASPVPLDDPLQWWRYMPGASWKHPQGPGSRLGQQEGSPGRARRIRRCRGICRVGGQAPPHRSGVRVRCAGRAGSAALSLGQRDDAG